jgi:hypothetical protein
VTSVYGVNDGLQAIKGAHVLARFLDGKMRPILVRNWVTELPAIGMRSEARNVTLPIPAEMPPSYLFLDLTLTSANGELLSRRAYWIRVVSLPKDRATRDKQLSAPDPLVKSGPWLKTEIEEAPTEIATEILGCDRVGPEARLRLTIKNTGPNPAYPVRLTIEPDSYSVLWTDNYFWLDPGESVSLQATIRLDMTGLDPMLNPKVAEISDLALKVSAWNAKGGSFFLGGRDIRR